MINQKDENTNLGLNSHLREVLEHIITSYELTLIVVRGCKSPEQGRQRLSFILNSTTSSNGSQFIVPTETKLLNLE